MTASTPSVCAGASVCPIFVIVEVAAGVEKESFEETVPVLEGNLPKMMMTTGQV
jgi:hypothetical protein